MGPYEYKVVAAPTRGVKAKGVKKPEARFSFAIEQLMNEMAAEGWEYQRAETLPSVERAGLTSTTTTWRNVLVFRKSTVLLSDIAESAPVSPEPARVTASSAPEESDEIISPETPDDDASRSEGASRMLRDNGVEDVSEVSGMTNSLKTLAGTRSSNKSND